MAAIFRPEITAEGRQIRDEFLPLSTCRIDLDDNPVGTGFFITPTVILTAAHLFKDFSMTSGAEEIIGIQVRAPGIDEFRAIHPIDITREEDLDLALLSIDKAESAQHCVLLDEQFSSFGSTITYGFPEEHPEGQPAILRLEGRSGGSTETGRFREGEIKLSSGRVTPGMSGSPLLNTESGAVCGVLVRTRDAEQADAGGYAKTLNGLLVRHRDKLRANREHHRKNDEWLRDLTEEQRNALQTTWVTEEPMPTERSLIINIEPKEDEWQVSADFADAGDDEWKRLSMKRVDLNEVKREVAELFRRWALRGKEQVASDDWLLLGQILCTAIATPELREKLRSDGAGNAEDHPKLGIYLAFGASDDKELVNLPWEFLNAIRPQTGSQTALQLAVDDRFTLSRVLGRTRAVTTAGPPPLASERPRGSPKVLLVEPGTEATQSILERVMKSINGQIFDVQDVTEVDAHSLKRELAPPAPAILHYFGRGMLYNNQDQLDLAPGPDQKDWYSGDELAGLIDSEAKSPLVVLLFMANYEGRVPADFTALAARLLVGPVRAVVATQGMVDEPDRLVAFSEAFYNELAKKRSVERAVQRARGTVRQAGRESRDPLLFCLLRSEPGPLSVWDVEPVGAARQRPQAVR